MKNSRRNIRKSQSTEVIALPPFWAAFRTTQLPILRAMLGNRAKHWLKQEIDARMKVARIIGDAAAAEAEIAYQRSPDGRGIRAAFNFDRSLVPVERQAAANAAVQMGENEVPQDWRSQVVPLEVWSAEQPK